MQNNYKTEQVQRLLVNLNSTLSQLEREGIVPAEALKQSRYEQIRLLGIPITIFNSKLAVLESVVKYMRENLFLNYGDISRLIGRSESVVGVTYRRAKKKVVGALNVDSADYISFGIFSNKSLSVLEVVSINLLERGFSIKKIAKILCRDYKTVWTVLSRAQNKLKGVKNKQ